MSTVLDKGNQRMHISKADPISARVDVPGSKSLTNRYLLLAGLANGTSTLKGALESEDTFFMRSALSAMGINVVEDGTTWLVHGQPAWLPPKKRLFIGNAGTAMRFLTPALAGHSFPVEIGGNSRMAIRPIRDLVESLQSVNVTIDYLEKDGCPPVRILGPIKGNELRVRGDASSQYLSGLLMALPLTQRQFHIVLDGPLVSKTYVEMTLACLEKFGINWRVLGEYRAFQIDAGSRYCAAEVLIEPDASTASYWFALPLMVGGKITVAGIPEKSSQGDFGLLEIIKKMGADLRFSGGEVTICCQEPLQGIDVDMNTMSDVAPTLAVIATRARTPTIIRNIGNMRIKECDRIATLQKAFDLLGLRMTSGSDWMKIEPGAIQREAKLNPEDDHRMAMVFGLLGFAYGGIEISDPECVSKTYPKFWDAMAAVLHPKSEN